MDTYIYQLKFTSEAEAVSELKAKGVIDDNKFFTSITEAVVWNIKPVLVDATFDENGDVLTEAEFLDGYHVDILVYEPINFGTNETNPTRPLHTFGQ